MDSTVNHVSGRQRSSSLAVGVDLGGTWIRVVVVARRPRAAPGAPRHCVAGTHASFCAVVVGRSPSLARRRGARRVDLARAQQRCVAAARSRAARGGHLRRRGRVLGALDGRPGMLVLAGTGSIVLGRDGQGRVARAGGLGPLIGDEGSAFWLGREWLRLTPEGRPHRAGLYARRPDAVARIAALAPLVSQPRAPRPPASPRDRRRRPGASGGAGGGVVRTLQPPLAGARLLERQRGRQRLVSRRPPAGARPPLRLPLASPRDRRRPGRRPPRQPAGRPRTAGGQRGSGAAPRSGK